MFVPLVFGLEYYGPSLPRDPRAFLGPESPEGLCEAFSPEHPLSRSFLAFPLSGEFFSPIPVLEPVLFVSEDKTRDISNFL